MILNVTGLGITRDGNRILDGITWGVRKGEHWVILGANGSGKTSLLSALTGYLTPTTGEVEVLGQRYGASDWRELRRAIGIVSSSVRQMMHDEEVALDSVISGKFAMIDFWGKSTAADRARAMRILRQVECGHLAARPWRVLSQGERQRILIGRALMAKPRLLLLDEPSLGVAPKLVQDIARSIVAINRDEKVSVLLVEQNSRMALRISRRAYAMTTGRVALSGVSSELLADDRVKQLYLGGEI